MPLVWFRCADVYTGCLLKTAEATLSKVTASHKSQRQAEQGGGTKRIKAGLQMHFAYVSLLHEL